MPLFSAPRIRWLLKGLLAFPLALHDLNQLSEPQLIRVSFRQASADPLHDACVALRPSQDPKYLVLRELIRKREFERLLSEDLLDVLPILREQGDRVSSWRFERAARHHPQVVKKRAVDHRHEDAPAHCLDYLAEMDGRHHLYIQLRQVIRISVIRVDAYRRLGPGRGRVPAVPDEADWPHLFPH